MATTLFEGLRDERDQIAAFYETHFAGQNRVTRDAGQLKELISRSQNLVKNIDEVPTVAQGSQLVSLREDLMAMISTYEGESRAIQDAKAMGPYADQFAPLASQANFVFAKYQRHFAGQNRATRDQALLQEMLEDLTSVATRMQALHKKHPNSTFQRDIEAVTSNMNMYKKEIAEIQRAQTTASPEDKSSILATLANEQFAIYSTHFAGKNRTTRRPALLQRAIDSLKHIKSEMEKLKAQGHVSENNDQNIGIVQENMHMYENEIGEIRKAKQATRVVDLMGMFGDAANQEFNLYREHFSGKNRKEVNRVLLGQIVDRLAEIWKQMQDLARIEENETNTRNIDIVREQLELYETEWQAIALAQQNS